MRCQNGILLAEEKGERKNVLWIKRKNELLGRRRSKNDYIHVAT